MELDLLWMKKKVEEVQVAAGCDPEHASVLEHNLHVRILRGIASRQIKGAAVRVLARMAAETDQIKFQRW